MKHVRIASFKHFVQKNYRKVGDMVTKVKVVVENTKKMVQLSLILCLLLYCSVYFPKVYEFIARVLNQEYRKTRWDALIEKNLHIGNIVAKVYTLLIVFAFVKAVPFDTIFWIVMSLIRTGDFLYILSMIPDLLNMFSIVFIYLFPVFSWFGFSNKVSWLQKMCGAE